MGKPHRSPLLGFNHNVRHLGRVFHVQTEDSGPSNPRLFTHLFFEGTILVSRKQDYAAAAPDDEVRTLMKAQHKAMVKDLTRSQHDERIVAFFRARGEELPAVEGATPTSVMAETPGPIPTTTAGEIDVGASGGGVPLAFDAQESEPPVVLSNDAGAAAFAASASGSPSPSAFAAPSASPAVVVAPVTAPRRTQTKPIDTQRGRASPAPVVVGRAPDARRAPFVRSGAPAVATTASADGVVVQRSVVVGTGGPVPAPRPARIRPPVPYVVNGNGAAVMQPGGALGAGVRGTSQGGLAVADGTAGAAVGSPSGAPPRVIISAPSLSVGSAAAGVVTSSAPVSAVEAPRPAGGFGGGLIDDKSLDEVILEYLSEDGESD